MVKLTDAEKLTLDLHNKGASQRTIALHLGITRSAVKDRLRSARKKLAEQENPPK